MVSGTSLHIKNRLAQHSKSSCFPVTYSYSFPHINIADCTLARQGFVCVCCVCACLLVPVFTLLANAPCLRKQRQRISLMRLSSFLFPPKKLILILNVCSGSRSGQVRDCLLFPPSGHLKLHLIQMPICSTQIGRGWSQLPGWLVCLGILCTCSTKVCMSFACVCERAHVSSSV